MVKFFMPKQKSIPNNIGNRSNRNKQKNKKQTKNYRILVFQQIQPIVKKKKLENIDMTVKQVKKLHKSYQNKQIIAQQYQTNLQESLKQLNQYKSVKNKSLKKIVLNIMKQSLNITNFSLLRKALSQQNRDLIKQDGTLNQDGQYEINENQKQLMAEVIESKWYTAKVEKIGEMMDGISKKKHLLKERSKQRKIRKLEKRKVKVGTIQDQEQFDEEGQQSMQEQIQQKQESKLEKKAKRRKDTQSQQDSQQQEIQRNRKKMKEFYRNVPQKQKRQRNQKNRQNNKNYKQTSQSNRTQFIKKGRNKVKQDKMNKKHALKQSYKNKKIMNQNQSKPAQKIQKQIHPSLKAKLDQKKQMYISKFQGKKIIL